jgi:transposase
LAVDAHGMPVRVIVTAGPVADCTQACQLIDGIEAEHLLADRGYDTDEIVQTAIIAGMQPVIPPKKNRRYQRPYDLDLYKIRHLVENAFAGMKQFRAVSTRYNKLERNFASTLLGHLY